MLQQFLVSDHPKQDIAKEMAKPHIPYDGPVVTRADAIVAGLTRFFTGKPCKHGHLSERTSANGGCIACNAITNRDAYYAEGPEKKEKRRRRANAWVAANIEKHRANGRLQMKKIGNRWRAANPERAREWSREARERDPEAVKVRVKRYLESEKGKLQACIARSKRRALKLNADGSYTAAEIRSLFVKQHGQCVYCNVSLADGYDADHIQPLCKGGSNWISNIQLLCGSCNKRKWALDHDEFVRRLKLKAA